ncbi:hypothetical protein BURKHO8Y_110193 [Burkholderia sp. 8Y]|nr:hypothetical protein BURKHO8Y_110193 [Burkholderia sp. 8Y]
MSYTLSRMVGLMPMKASGGSLTLDTAQQRVPDTTQRARRPHADGERRASQTEAVDGNSRKGSELETRTDGLHDRGHVAGLRRH